MKKIGFSGTLDPITNGHLWVIEEARAIADEVVVFISENPFKKCQISADVRRQIVLEIAAERDWKNLSVVLVKSDYTARAAKKHDIDYLLRGIRNNNDFDYENLLQQANVDVVGGAKTMFVMPPRDLGSVSSSFIKGLQGPVGWHWLTKKFIPAPAYRVWILDWLYKEWQSLWPAAYADQNDRNKAEHWFQHLTSEASYQAHHRHYHNLDHLAHGLSELNVWAASTDAKTESITTLKKAFWFHDAIYGQHEADISDEEASAQLWLGSELGPQNANEVATLIRATDHFQQMLQKHELSEILLGADLAILGQSNDIYNTYAKAVRKEYAAIPATIYHHNRRKALLHLCEKAKRNCLYTSPYFSDQYTTSALKNMEREIAEIENNAETLDNV